MDWCLIHTRESSRGLRQGERRLRLNRLLLCSHWSRFMDRECKAVSHRPWAKSERQPAHSHLSHFESKRNAGQGVGLHQRESEWGVDLQRPEGWSRLQPVEEASPRLKGPAGALQDVSETPWKEGLGSKRLFRESPSAAKEGGLSFLPLFPTPWLCQVSK